MAPESQAQIGGFGRCRGGQTPTTMESREYATEEALATAVGSLYEGALGEEPAEVRVVANRLRLTVLVDGPRTQLERSLYAAGEDDLITRERRILRRALAAPLRAAVERCLGDEVTRLSGSHDPDSGTDTLSFQLGVRARIV